MEYNQKDAMADPAPVRTSGDGSQRAVQSMRSGSGAQLTGHQTGEPVSGSASWVFSDNGGDNGEPLPGETETAGAESEATVLAAFVARCVAASSCYAFVLARHHERCDRHWWDCVNLETGETYEVSRFDCSCWDYVVRRKPHGTACKHMIVLELHLIEGKTFTGEIVIGNRS